MTATARAAANAVNAQSSTGPRTEEGKARSSRNAVKHGLTSKQLVIAPGEEEQFAELHHALLDQLAPQGAIEMSLFNMLAHAAWNIQRFRTLEAQLMATGIHSLLDEKTAKALDRLQRYASANQRTYFKAVKELRTVQNNRLLRHAPERLDNQPLPELVSVAELTKRTKQADSATVWAAMRASEDAINAVRSRILQNEPNARLRLRTPARPPECTAAGSVL
jgi:hypothetical protein